MDDSHIGTCRQRALSAFQSFTSDRTLHLVGFEANIPLVSSCLRAHIFLSRLFDVGSPCRPPVRSEIWQESCSESEG